MSEYQVHAIRYARQDDRRASDNFLEGGDPHAVMPMDFFVWAIVGADRTIIVDTGFDVAAAHARGRTVSRPIAEGLKQIGIDPASVRDVILTHLHWDHAGNHEVFPNARYHVQEREMHFCTGRCMCEAPLRRAYNLGDVTNMVTRLFEGRVVFHDEDSQFADGISLHRLGGHTDGLQVVRIRTRRGHVVLASDAAHFYANVLQRRPFPVLANMDDMLAGYEALERLSDGPAHLIPGHDPQVLSLFPASQAGLDGIARLDGDPARMPS